MNDQCSKDYYFRIPSVSAWFGHIQMGRGTLDVSDMYASWRSDVFPILLMKSVEKVGSALTEATSGPFGSKNVDISCADLQSSISAENGSEVDSVKADSSQAVCDTADEVPDEDKWLLVNTDNHNFHLTMDIAFPVASAEQCKEGFLKTDIPDRILQAVNQLPFMVCSNAGDAALNENFGMAINLDLYLEDLKRALFIDFVEVIGENREIADIDEGDPDKDRAEFA